jgi:hypothetical protein
MLIPVRHVLVGELPQYPQQPQQRLLTVQMQAPSRTSRQRWGTAPGCELDGQPTKCEQMQPRDQGEGIQVQGRPQALL